MAKIPFELFQLRCFLIVAEELSFRRAAQRLNMTQPPLSRQIKLLEQGIGLKLIERDRRTVKLTPAGRSFQSGAQDLLARAEFAVLSARQAERGEAGAVTMGFVPSAALDFVPRMVATLKQDMPTIRFDPVEMMSYEIEEALLSGRIDLGLTRTTGRSSDIESVRIVREPFVLAMPRGHHLCATPDLAADHLNGEAYVGYSAERGGFLRDIHTALFVTTGVSPEVVQEVSQTQTVLSLVNIGLGVALVPRSATAMQMNNLEFRPIDLPEQFCSTLYLNFTPHRSAPLHTRVREVILAELRQVAKETA